MKRESKNQKSIITSWISSALDDDFFVAVLAEKDGNNCWLTMELGICVLIMLFLDGKQAIKTQSFSATSSKCHKHESCSYCITRIALTGFMFVTGYMFVHVLEISCTNVGNTIHTDSTDRTKYMHLLANAIFLRSFLPLKRKKFCAEMRKSLEKMYFLLMQLESSCINKYILFPRASTIA